MLHMAPPSLLEGVYSSGYKPDKTPSFIAHDTKLDAEVRALHNLARQGVLPLDSAERQLNTYLVAASKAAARSKIPTRWLLLPIADSPHHSLLPDLGYLIHCILSRSPIPCSLSSALEQCLPALRHPTRVNTFSDSRDILLNLVLALLLGLYPGGTVKRPEFGLRVHLYESVHKLLTTTRGRQVAFCVQNHAILLMACMEYVARVLPAQMPAQTMFLHSRDPTSSAIFFRRVPVLCDEFRQSLGEMQNLCWRQVRKACAFMIEKVSRLKKAACPTVQRPQALLITNHNRAPVALHWDAPYLKAPESASEYTLLADALSLNDAVLHSIHRDIQVYPLPENLRRMQASRLSSCAEPRLAYLRSRMLICMHCCLTSKNLEHMRLRLDTLRQALICCHCGHNDLVSVDMVGRVLRHKQRFFILCPGCMTIKPYNCEQVWMEDSDHTSCPHSRPSCKAVAKTRRACRVCSEQVTHPSIQRVDHLTGQMVEFYLCQRHCSQRDGLRWYVNARQMVAYCG